MTERTTTTTTARAIELGCGVVLVRSGGRAARGNTACVSARFNTLASLGLVADLLFGAFSLGCRRHSLNSVLILRGSELVGKRAQHVRNTRETFGTRKWAREIADFRSENTTVNSTHPTSDRN
uniref:(northern house mosquito) hypothetical protein n=1 Tax=Culex pipiens TaxID=7175 RepID=A0A8D8PFC1_CULPI